MVRVSSCGAFDVSSCVMNPFVVYIPLYMTRMVTKLWLQSYVMMYTVQRSFVLLEYFASEKPLRMSQISRKFDPLRSNYCVLARIVCIY